jgi:mannitol-1-phosphate/altronate dehydrogenase
MSLDEAEREFQDFFTSLPPDELEEALKYQAGLEAEVAASGGNWNAVILKRMNHVNMLMAETLDEFVTVMVENELKRIAR